MSQVYLHNGQLMWYRCNANSSFNLCARRWGKSYPVALQIWTNVLEMPRSTGVFVASTFRQAHSRTLPAALQALDAFGVKRDIHYVIGHKPDPKLGFDTPLFLPSDLKDCVWFANGTIMIIVSQEVVLSANSMTIHWLVADEAKGLNFDKLQSEILPAIGGSSRYYNDPTKYPHLWGQSYFSDMPATKDGQWLITIPEKEYDKQLCDDLIRLETLRQKLLAEGKVSQAMAMVPKLNFLRSRATYFQERSIFDNIAIVGNDYVRRCARDLTPMVFKASILCQRVNEAEGKFYVNFDPLIHTYSATNNDLLAAYKDKPFDSIIDGDVQRNKSIAIAFDYNAQINWLVAGQIQGKLLKIIHSFYNKGDKRLRDVVQQFCQYYQYHPTKTVHYYYDSTAKGINYIEKGHDAVFMVKDELQRHGWTVMEYDLGQPKKHDTKHLIINNAFQGSEKLFPMLNKDNNVDLIQAIPLTGYTINTLGFRKDKSGEKTPESPATLPYELRTDGTDAMDTLILGCILRPYDDGKYIYA